RATRATGDAAAARAPPHLRRPRRRERQDARRQPRLPLPGEPAAQPPAPRAGARHPLLGPAQPPAALPTIPRRSARIGPGGLRADGANTPPWRAGLALTALTALPAADNNKLGAARAHVRTGIPACSAEPDRPAIMEEITQLSVLRLQAITCDDREKGNHENQTPTGVARRSLAVAIALRRSGTLRNCRGQPGTSDLGYQHQVVCEHELQHAR